MTPRTPTKPPTDPTMQRKLKALTHPDNRGDHELFIWTVSLIETACSGPQNASRTKRPSPPPQPEPSRNSGPDRVPFSSTVPFAALTGHALQLATSRSDVYGDLLKLLKDCWPLDNMQREQERGASYKRLAAIGHLVGMDGPERSKWYRVAESVPLSDRHAGHIIFKLKGRG